MKMRNRLLLLISSIMLFIVEPLSAQMNYKGLIFSEVYLDESRPEQSWLEIYNPTSNPLILEKFRFSHILTTNMLPEDIVKNGGIEIPSKECILICSDKSVFGTKINGNTQVIQISTIKKFYKGGFIALTTKYFDENGIDMIRYGESELTSEFSEKLGNFVIPISEDSLSYSRILNEDETTGTRPKFIKGIPTPGTVTAKDAKNE